MKLKSENGMVGGGGERRRACRVLQLFSHPLSNRISSISSKDFMQENLEEMRLHKCFFFFPGAAISCITACYSIPLFFSLSGTAKVTAL